MDYRTTSWVREFRAGVLSLAVGRAPPSLAGQPYGLSRSLARGAFETGMSRKPDGGEGTAWSSLHPAGSPEKALADALDRVR